MSNDPLDLDALAAQVEIDRKDGCPTGLAEQLIRELREARATIQTIRDLRRLGVPLAEFWVRLDAALDGETKRPTLPPPDPGMAVRACCGDTHLGDECDPSALDGAE